MDGKSMVMMFGLETCREGIPCLVSEAAVDMDVDNETLSTPEKIAACVNRAYRLEYQFEEKVVILGLNCRMKPVGLMEISHGTQTVSPVSVQGVFIRALLMGASGIVIVHNHPSGEVSPSGDDQDTADRIADAGNLLGIPLKDFIIIGKNRYLSFQENGLLQEGTL